MPVAVSADANLFDCEHLMRGRKLTSLIVAEEGYPIGVVKSFDA
ncbi:CBS domain-containing protein [Salinicola tamaricis]